jgi:hypothetical protein
VGHQQLTDAVLLDLAIQHEDAWRRSITLLARGDHAERRGGRYFLLVLAH